MKTIIPISRSKHANPQPLQASKRTSVLTLSGIAISVILSIFLALSTVQPKFQTRISSNEITHFYGKAYGVRIQSPKKFGMRYVSTDRKAKTISDLRVQDNQIAAKKSQLLNVITVGKGLYHHDGDWLYFSSIDGSDPRKNGHVYKATGSIVPTNRSMAICSILLSISIFVSVYGLLSNLKRSHIEAFFSLKTRDIRRAISITHDSSRHWPELDGIRGIACLSVLLAHCFMGLLHPIPGSLLGYIQSYTMPFLLAGVDLFFVLSGFLIGGILMDSKSKPHYFQFFWIRRAARILPVLWLLLASYAAALFCRSAFALEKMDLWLLAKPIPPFWTYATFTQSIPIALGGYGGPRWVGITWSLAIEEQFYLFFPVAVYFLSRRSIVLTAIAGVIAAPCLRALFANLIGNWYAPYVLMPSRIDGLMWGVLIAALVRNKRALVISMKGKWVIDALAIFFAYLIATNHPLVNIWNVPACGPFPPLKNSMLAVIGAVLILRIFIHTDCAFNKIWHNKLLTGTGLVSYGLYMYHQAINGSVHAFFFGQEPSITTLNEFLAALCIMGTAIGVSCISYHLIEKRVRRFGYSFCATFRRREAATDTTARETSRTAAYPLIKK